MRALVTVVFSLAVMFSMIDLAAGEADRSSCPYLGGASAGCPAFEDRGSTSAERGCPYSGGEEPVCPYGGRSARADARNQA
jgi:hypothetical protein